MRFFAVVGMTGFEDDAVRGSLQQSVQMKMRSQKVKLPRLKPAINANKTTK